MFDGLHDWFVEYVFGPVWNFLKVLFTTTLKAELEALAPIATQIVADIAADPTIVTNEARRAEAESRLLAQVTAASLTVGTNALQMAVLIAVANLRAQGK